jgi:hypothetical protein
MASLPTITRLWPATSVVHTDTFVIVGKMRRGPRTLAATFLIGMGLASVVLFGVGLMPAYLLEHDGGLLRDAWERCPERIPSERGYDAECVLNLMEHGPIYLGKEPLAASFALGAAALIGSFLFDGRSVTWCAAALLLFSYFLVGYSLAFGRRGGEPIQAAYIVGLVAIVAAAALAWGWNRRAVVVLSAVYVAAWIGLLAWNAERARHFLGEAA